MGLEVVLSRTSIMCKLYKQSRENEAPFVAVSMSMRIALNGRDGRGLVCGNSQRPLHISKRVTTPSFT
jgi:hypothetical protein